jgi:hypothetical protein
MKNPTPSRQAGKNRLYTQSLFQTDLREPTVFDSVFRQAVRTTAGKKIIDYEQKEAAGAPISPDL